MVHVCLENSFFVSITKSCCSTIVGRNVVVQFVLYGVIFVSDKQTVHNIATSEFKTFNSTQVHLHV